MKNKTGKFSGKRNYRSIALLSSLILMFSIAVGTTVAYLIDSTRDVKNTFTPSTVDITVTEDFDGQVKSNVKIKNELADGKGVTAYIRARVIVNWVDEDGNILPNVPEGATKAVIFGSDWQESNGYYYYKGTVTPNASTTNLINKAEYTVPEGVTDRLQIDIIAEGIQAIGQNSEGKLPVELAWGETAAGIVSGK